MNFSLIFQCWLSGKRHLHRFCKIWFLSGKRYFRWVSTARTVASWRPPSSTTPYTTRPSQTESTSAVCRARTSTRPSTAEGASSTTRNRWPPWPGRGWTTDLWPGTRVLIIRRSSGGWGTGLNPLSKSLTIAVKGDLVLPRVRWKWRSLVQSLIFPPNSYLYLKEIANVWTSIFWSVPKW